MLPCRSFRARPRVHAAPLAADGTSQSSSFPPSQVLTWNVGRTGLRPGPNGSLAGSPMAEKLLYIGEVGKLPRLSSAREGSCGPPGLPWRRHQRDLWVGLRSGASADALLVIPVPEHHPLPVVPPAAGSWCPIGWPAAGNPSALSDVQPLLTHSSLSSCHCCAHCVCRCICRTCS